MKRILLAFSIGLIICSVSLLSSGKPQPISFDRWTGGSQGHSIIDKQSWWLDSSHVDPTHTVTNPGPVTFGRSCTWDINEHSDFSTITGFIAAGTSTSREDCHVFDFDPVYSCFGDVCSSRSFNSNWVGLQVYASSSNLVSTMCFQPQGDCFTATPVYDSTLKLYNYAICAQALYIPDDLAVIDIDGSNGGRGVPTIITRTVTNPTANTVKTAVAKWGLASDVITAPGCPEYPWRQWPFQSSYPWRWIGERV